MYHVAPYGDGCLEGAVRLYRDLEPHSTWLLEHQLSARVGVAGRVAARPYGTQRADGYCSLKDSLDPLLNVPGWVKCRRPTCRRRPGPRSGLLGLSATASSFFGSPSLTICLVTLVSYIRTEDGHKRFPVKDRQRGRFQLPLLVRLTPQVLSVKWRTCL